MNMQCIENIYVQNNYKNLIGMELTSFSKYAKLNWNKTWVWMKRK